MKHLFRHYLDSFDLDSTEAGREFAALTASVRADEAFIRLSGYRHHYAVARSQHVTSVAYLTFLVCRARGRRTEEACRAALLHDLFYYDRRQGTRPFMATFRHPALSLSNAEKLYPLSAVERDIILHHMWPLTRMRPKTKEGMIVCLLDKYCAVHEFLHSLFPILYRATFRRKGKTLT